MSELDILQKELFSRYGNVTRARGCFLYTQKGVRLTDLYQEGGRAILGWGGTSAFTMLKNTLNRGITGSFETGFRYRTVKAVCTLFNSERDVFFYSSYENALKAALLISKDGVNKYQPWSTSSINWTECPVIIFTPTLPWTQNLFMVASLTGLASEVRELLPREILVPSPLHAALARSIYDLRKALQERKESDWFIYDTVLTKYWERRGPYLFPKIPEEKYREFVLYCLERHIVISPEYNVPSIVPFGADKGVFTLLKNEPFSW